MMLKLFAWFIFFLCITGISCRMLEAFPTLESQDFNLSEPVLQGREIHGLNRTVSFEAKGDKEEYGKHHKFLLSKKAKSGNGAYGGANIPHRHGKAKNAASSLVSPPLFRSNTVLHVILTVIGAFPTLLLNHF